MRRAVDAEDPAPLRRVQEDARAAAGVAEWMQRGIRTVPDCSEASGPASCTGVHSSASWVDSIHKGATEVKTTGMGMADGGWSRISGRSGRMRRVVSTHASRILLRFASLLIDIATTPRNVLLHHPDPPSAILRDLRQRVRDWDWRTLQAPPCRPAEFSGSGSGARRGGGGSHWCCSRGRHEPGRRSPRWEHRDRL